MASLPRLPQQRQALFDNLFIHTIGPGLMGVIGVGTALAVGGPGFLLVAGALAGIVTYQRMKVDIPALILDSNRRNMVPPNHPVSRMVERLAQKAGLEETPKCIFARREMMMPERPNIPFAGTVGTPSSSVIIVSRDIENSMTPSELEAVLAHEIAHIKHADTKRMTWQAGLSMLSMMSLAYIAVMSTFAAMGAAAPALGLFAVGAGTGGALVTLGLQAAISRATERRADRGSVALAKNPWALASALGRIVELQIDALKQMNKPEPGPVGKLIINLLRTHPKTKTRRHNLVSLGARLIEQNPELIKIKRRTARELEVFEQVQRLRTSRFPPSSGNDNDRPNTNGPTLQAAPGTQNVWDIKGSSVFNEAANDDKPENAAPEIANDETPQRPIYKHPQIRP